MKLYKSKVSILIFTDLGDQIMNKYLYTIILNIVYKYKSTYVILQNKIIKVEIIALKMQFYKILVVIETFCKSNMNSVWKKISNYDDFKIKHCVYVKWV